MVRLKITNKIWLRNSESMHLLCVAESLISLSLHEWYLLISSSHRKHKYRHSRQTVASVTVTSIYDDNTLSRCWKASANWNSYLRLILEFCISVLKGKNQHGLFILSVKPWWWRNYTSILSSVAHIFQKLSATAETQKQSESVPVPCVSFFGDLATPGH